MPNLLIEWKHFDKDGKTCVRCSGTGINLADTIKELQTEFGTKGIKIEFKETKLPENRMSESNEILIDGILLEKLIPDADTGENNCTSCADLIGNPTNCRCRTISQGEETFEEIPIELIKQAILNRINLK
jgi:hypothetical protein